MKFRTLLLASMLPAICVPAAAFAQVSTQADAAQTPADDSAQQNSGVQDIVVTAQRREQNLQDVPIAVTAITSDAIAGNRILNVSDLSAIAPSLSVREGAGGSRLPQYTLRGIYTFGSAVGADKGVSLYLDGVYVQSVSGSIFEFADIDRVEVLRGPQGTLFGRNATGGAVSITTREPTGEFGVRQDFSYGNRDHIRSKTRVDLPRFGPFAVTASYLHSQIDGDTRNLGAGTRFDFGPATNNRVGTLTSPDRLGGSNTEGVFVAVDADFHPDLRASYKFDYSQTDYVTSATGVSYLAGPSSVAFGGTPPTLVPFSFYSSGNPKTPITRERPDAVNNAFTLPGTSRSLGHNLTLEYKASDVITLKNILAYRKSRTLNNGFQLDGLGGLTLPAAAGGFPFVFVGNNSFNNEKQWSNEFQVNLSTDFFNITGGLLYFHNKQQAGGSPDLFNVLQGAPIIGQNTSVFPRAFVVPRNTGFVPPSVETSSKALYFQSEFFLTDKFSVTGGIRFTKDKKDGRETLPGSPAAPSNGLFVPIFYRDDQVTFLLGANYKFSDDVLTYAKYSTGYISGGQLATITFQPEKARSWEAGLKADLFDRKLRTNLALFYVDYSNIQAATLGSLTGVASAAPFGQAIVSYGDSVAKGVELETTFVPVRNLTFTANVGYLDFKFKDETIFAPLLIGAGAPGVQEFGRPKWTGSTSVQYDINDVMGGRLSFRTDLNYKSSSLFSNDITPGSGPTAQVDPAYREALTGQEQFLLNGRIALSRVPLGPITGEIAVWGKNILNDKSIIQATGLGFASAVQYQQERAYGIDLSVQF